jgi:hypothetical protein
MGGSGPILLPSLVAWLDEERITDQDERRGYRQILTRVDARWCVLQDRQRQREANKHSKNPKPVDKDDDEDDEDEP